MHAPGHRYRSSHIAYGALAHVRVVLRQQFVLDRVLRERHPDGGLGELGHAGLVVTINSDDPPMFGTNLTNEYAVAARLLELDEAGVAELAKTAVRASFAEDSVKHALLQEIDSYVAG